MRELFFFSISIIRLTCIIFSMTCRVTTRLYHNDYYVTVLHGVKYTTTDYRNDTSQIANDIIDIMT